MWYYASAVTDAQILVLFFRPTCWIAAWRHLHELMGAFAWAETEMMQVAGLRRKGMIIPDLTYLAY
jgi:hypothetical protein